MSDDRPRDLDPAHSRPDGAPHELVSAVGTVSEAMEWIERARGRLYDFHQYTGHAHFLLLKAAGQFREAGETESAEFLEQEIAGLNVLEGRWTFQIIEEYNSGYYAAMRAADQRLHDVHMAGRRHVFEAELKQRLRTPGSPGHEANPEEAHRFLTNSARRTADETTGDMGEPG